MSKLSSSKLNFLSLNNQEKSLEKHPSMKTFFNQVKEKEQKEKNEEKDNNIINIIQSEEEEKLDNINNETENINIQINIIECEHKLSDGKDTFFIDTNNNIINYMNKKVYKNNNDIKPLNYEFNEKQKKLDSKITKQIFQRKDYNIIEKNFDGMLKK